jgi:hypothetical protein
MFRQKNSTRIGYVRGYDRDGRAIHVCDPKAPKDGDEIDMLQYVAFCIEKAVACTMRKSSELSEDNIPLEKYIHVADYTGFKLSDSGQTSLSKKILETVQNHYPERLHRAYLFNTPLIFRFAWAMAKPFIDADTRQKVVFCSGKDIDKFVNNVLEPEKLEPGLGGPTDNPVRPLDATEYMALPWDVGFDE